MLCQGLGSFMPRENNDEYYYQTGRIFCMELSLAFEGRKNKFIVLLDDKEPPLFFLINSQPRGLDRNHHVELHGENYSFLTKKISYLDYDSTFESYDDVESVPTRQEILDLINSEPDRYKGILKEEDAEALLYGVENSETAIEPVDLDRIIAGLRLFLKKVSA